MKWFFIVILCLLLSNEAPAIFLKYRSRTESTFLGKVTFNSYMPFYFEGGNQLMNKIFYYPGRPLRIPEDLSYPATIYFAECTNGQKLLFNWLRHIPDSKTLEHFVLFVPCNIVKDIKHNQVNDFKLFWNEFSGLNGADPLKNHLLASRDNYQSALKLVETLPEMFTSLTLLNKVPPLTNVSRYKGTRTRIYASKKSQGFTSLKTEYEKFKSMGARAEWIEVDATEENLISNSVASTQHWDWVKSLSWGN